MSGFSSHPENSGGNHEGEPDLAIPDHAACFRRHVSIGSAAELNPAAVVYKLPDQIPWGRVDARGAQSAVVVGDPTKPGFYTWSTTRMDQGQSFQPPHFHPNDRYIVVLQGTWWVGSGPKFDPDKGTVPMPAGSFVTHYREAACTGTAPRTKTPCS